MIVDCPSCGVHYRHHAEVVAAALARCSRCDESFPLVARRRRYTLAAVGSPVTVEVEAPAVAVVAALPDPGMPVPAEAVLERFQEPVADAPNRFRLTPEDLTGPTGAPATPTELSEIPDLSDDLDLPGYEDALTRPLEDSPPEPPDEGVSAAPQAEPAKHSRRVREVPAVLFLATLGASLAYYGSLSPQVDTLTQTAIGGIGGLFGGWAVARWMARQQ